MGILLLPFKIVWWCVTFPFKIVWWCVTFPFKILRTPLMLIGSALGAFKRTGERIKDISEGKF